MKFFIVLLIVGLSFNLFARGGDHVGNGGGLSESNFAFSRLKLKKIIESCLNSELCLTLDKEKQVAKAVLNIMDLELLTEGQLEYVSEKDLPGFFFLDGNVRVAKTGNNIGDKIYINRDLIYDKNRQALDYVQTMAILFHEFGHHTGSMEHDILDLVGAKIALFVARKSFGLGTLYGEVSLPVTKTRLIEVKIVITTPGQESLILITKNSTIDMTEEIINAVKKRVENVCQIDHLVCKMFLGVTEQKKYPVNVLYFQNAKFEKFMDPTIDKRHVWYMIKLTAYSYYNSSKVSSKFYHLPHHITLRVKLDNITHVVSAVSFLGIKQDSFFGLQI